MKYDATQVRSALEKNFAEEIGKGKANEIVCALIDAHPSNNFAKVRGCQDYLSSDDRLLPSSGPEKCLKTDACLPGASGPDSEECLSTQNAADLYIDSLEVRDGEVVCKVSNFGSPPERLAKVGKGQASDRQEQSIS